MKKTVKKKTTKNPLLSKYSHQKPVVKQVLINVDAEEKRLAELEKKVQDTTADIFRYAKAVTKANNLDLGKMFGVSDAFISMVINKRRTPSFATFKRIVATFEKEFSK